MKSYIISTEEGDFTVSTMNPELFEMLLEGISDPIGWTELHPRNRDKLEQYYGKDDLIVLMTGVAE
jgi:hypothetical protein